MAEYNQNSRYQQLEPVKNSGSGILWRVALVLVIFIFVIPAVKSIGDTLSFMSYGNFYQLKAQTPEVQPLGATLDDGSKAMYGNEFYLVRVYVENNSAYDANVYGDRFWMSAKSGTYFPEPWNPEAQGAFADWNNLELFPAQRGKELVLLYQMPESLTSAELVYPATANQRKTVKAVFLDEK